MMNTQPNQKKKIIFIRHAESLSNKAVHDFREERKLPDCWETFTSIDDFNHKVIYNPDLCDCGISQKGSKQCQEAKQKLINTNVDLIIVSPLERTLQTCQKIFADRFDRVKIIVEPLLAESLKYSSDISRKISGKQKSFSIYDFSRVKKQGDFWFLKNENQQNQKLYFEHLQAFPHYSFEQKQKQIAKFMYRKHLRESNENMRKRSKKIKQLIREYSQNYDNIVVVSHYYTIKHLVAKNISKNGEPLDEFYGPNCCIHERFLEQLIQTDFQ